MADDDFLFQDDDDEVAAATAAAPKAATFAEPWPVLVIDDDLQVHSVTRMLLKNFVFQGRPAELIDCYSAAEGREVLRQRHDIAVILLDVVMETDDAGLKLARWIRDDLGNRRVRIVLRTGQPGQAPERDVIVDYDINDYKSKTELTSQKLFTTMVGSLRAYQDLQTIERNRIGLEKILNASASLFDKRSMQEFVEGAIIQLEGLLRSQEGSIICCQGAEHGNRDIVVLAGTRAYADFKGRPMRDCLPPDIARDIENAFVEQLNVFAADRCILVFRTHDHGSSVFFLRRPDPFTEDERTLLEVFCGKVAIGYDNVCLYEDLSMLNNTLEQQVVERTREAREKSHLLEATLANMSDGLAAFDEHGALTVCNTPAFDLLHRPAGPRASAAVYDEIDRTLAAQAVAIIRDEQGHAEVEFADGRVVQVRRRPMTAGGEVVVYLDVTTERHQSRELVAARAQAEGANRAKSMFLATMSHEIRTPMNGVQGMLELLQHTRLDDEQRELVGVVKDSAEALLTIINDILDFSKIEAGRMVLEQAPLDLGAVVEGVADMLAPAAHKKGLRLSTFVDPAIPAGLVGDSVRLRQILFNLTGNAVKFTDHGAVAVDVTLVARRDGVGHEDGAADLRLRIIDTGIGMTAETAERLFRPFVQADESTARRFGGTGLGLSISQRLVDLMQGVIHIDSTEGVGSTFEVTLTLPVATAAAPPASPPALAGIRVLSALTDPFDRRGAEAYLTAAGATLVSFPPADVVVLDQAGLAQRDRWGATPLVLLAPREALFGATAAPPAATVSLPAHRDALVTAAAAAVGRRAGPAAAPAAVRVAPAAPGRAEALVDHRLVLVVEDHPVNRMVVERQLALLGIAADIACDGAEALQMLAVTDYAVVLSDCHMPRIDGFALARTIREAEQGSRRHLPIIAFTASATAEEADACLAAGMDDFLAKPVQMPELKAALDRWLAVASRAAAVGDTGATPCPPAPSPAAPPPIDVAALHALFDGDVETLRGLLDSFVRSARDARDELAQAFADADSGGVERAAHKLKGSSQIAGAAALGEAARRLEYAHRHGGADWPAMGGLLAEVDDALALVVAHIDGL